MTVRSTKSKIILSVSLIFFFCCFILISYNALKSRKSAVKNSEYEIIAKSCQYKSKLQERIGRAYMNSRTLADFFMFQKEYKQALSRSEAENILKSRLSGNSDFKDIFTAWEPDAFDNKDNVYKNKPASDSSGRFISVISREGRRALLHYNKSPYYMIPKSTAKDYITEPKLYNINGKAVRMVAFISPVIVNSQFLGIIGTSFNIEAFREMIKPFHYLNKEAGITLFTKSGFILADTEDKRRINRNTDEFDDFRDFRVSDALLSDSPYKTKINKDISIIFPVRIADNRDPWFLRIKFPVSLITADADITLIRQVGIGIFFSLLLISILYFFLNRQVIYLRDIAANARRVAKGDLDFTDIKTRRKEVLEVHNAWKDVILSLQEIKDVVNKIKVGDFSTDVKVRSEKDELAKAINRMNDNFRFIVKQAKLISEGDYSCNISPYSEKDELGKSIMKMVKSLKKYAWIKDGTAALYTRMRGNIEVNGLGKSVIEFLTRYLDIQLGLIYYIDDKGEFILCGNVNTGPVINIKKHVQGQTAVFNRAIKKRDFLFLKNIPSEYFEISTGSGHITPDNITVIPFFYEGKARGVIEFASIGALNEDSLEFINLNLESIATAFFAAYSGEKLQLILREAQLKSDELLTQKEELRLTNEKLSRRTGELESERNKISEQNAELERLHKDMGRKAEALELSSKYKSEFFANMSHELRTPLNSILILSHLLMENKTENLDSGQIEFARTINDAGSDLLQLINEILDLSKLQSGKMDADRERVDITDLTAKIHSMFINTAKQKGLKFNIVIDESAPLYFISDQYRIHQILRNLISNALKFTEAGRVELNIRNYDKNLDRYVEECEDELIIFSVKDTGIGVPDDKRDIIFEAFKQVDGTTSRKYGGTGLGLSISRELASLMGGVLLLDPHCEEGSNFLLILPVERKKGDNILKVRENLIVKSAVSVKEKSVDFPEDVPPYIIDDRNKINQDSDSLLIIASDFSLSRKLFDISKGNGFSSVVAADLHTGIHFAGYYKPDAVILDADLSGSLEYEVLKRLKENSVTRHIPVYMISSGTETYKAELTGVAGIFKKTSLNTNFKNLFRRISEDMKKRTKKLLIFDKDNKSCGRIEELFKGRDIEILISDSLFKKSIESDYKDIDCIIYNPLDNQSEEIKEFLKKYNTERRVPLILYSNRSEDYSDFNISGVSDKVFVVRDVNTEAMLVLKTTLFLHRAESSLSADARAILSVITEKESVFKGRKIIIADDDMRNVFALSSILQSRGVKTLTAKNGKEVLNILERESDTDLVLLDIMMPEMDGYETVIKIREKEWFRDLPVIALTANAMRGDRKKCIDAGATEYLSKPVDTDKLLSLLQVWLYR